MLLGVMMKLLIKRIHLFVLIFSIVHDQNGMFTAPSEDPLMYIYVLIILLIIFITIIRIL